MIILFLTKERKTKSNPNRGVQPKNQHHRRKEKGRGVIEVPLRSHENRCFVVFPTNMTKTDFLKGGYLHTDIKQNRTSTPWSLILTRQSLNDLINGVWYKDHISTIWSIWFKPIKFLKFRSIGYYKGCSVIIKKKKKLQVMWK